MNKKKWVNSKIIITITMVFVVCCFMPTSLWTAEKIDFYTENAKDYIRLLNENDSREDVSIGPIFGLTPNEKFTLLRQRIDFNKVTHYRYQQLYKGIPVWGIQTVVSRDSSNKVVRLHGAMIKGNPNDVKNIPTSLDALGALRRMQELHKEKDAGAAWNFSNEKYGTYIYLHKKEKAHLCYVVSFFADTECGNPSQPIHFIDVKTGKVLHSFDMLRYAVGTGPGGNEKIGCYEYGVDYPGFCVTQNGSICTMDCPKVKTVDLNHGTSGTTAHSYTCYRNTHKPINGACCPLNDAQYFGYEVFNMYNNWFYVDPLPFQLIMRVHYSTNYENAFWNGSSMTFGDGYTTFYPLVCLDVTAHEVSHGFTENNSDLIYSGQSGGINESFSDMAGEGAEYHMRGTNDFMVGYDIFKSPTGALRYMYDPPLDGISIDHVDDYYAGMDVHYSSGVFNKAFYLIATSPGWNTRMAFSIFVKANQDYWTSSTNFQQGAEGVRDAAEDYEYNCQDVVDAFAVVGINLCCSCGAACPPDTVGNTTVFASTSTILNRRAMPFTMPEDGCIECISMYHNGGSSNYEMILAVYDDNEITSTPQNRLAVTANTAISESFGWQTIKLPSPAFVAGGSTVWLAWVYESNPGIRYQTGSPGRYQSPDTWSGGMPDPFGSGTQANYVYSIYASYTPGYTPYKTVGNTTVFANTSTASNRRAMPFTMPENGTIESVSMYHTAGSGSMILAVYDGSSLPQNRLGVTATTDVSDTTGWQTIDLISSVYVQGSTTIWLAWVYEDVIESISGIRYQSGSPGRAQSPAAWSGGMPDPFGSSTQANYIYSIYATYNVD